MFGRRVQPDGQIGQAAGQLDACPGTVVSDDFVMSALRAYSDSRSIGATASLTEVYELPGHVIAAHAILGQEWQAVEAYVSAVARARAKEEAARARSRAGRPTGRGRRSGRG